MAADEYNIQSIFQSFREYLSTEQQKREEIREAVKELEETAKEMSATTQKIHQTTKETDIKDICSKVKENFSKCQTQIQSLDSKIPVGQYFRYCDQWRMTIQRLAFLSSYLVYLEHDRLPTREEVADNLGVRLEWKDGFFLHLDDYLIGLLLLANELSRLAVNSVILGNYRRPFAIAALLSELDAAFRLLNLKNDPLRKKFDGLKYDLKKVEQVVYDLSIRGLNNFETDQKDNSSN
ncbi:translin-like [Rhopilema esculentum]|uniref:translin-like n=1 Tax=Rhopilema esculentum TaxID=499914 RepID=UPI0031D83A95|eukprot:gene14207-5217_t